MPASKQSTVANTLMLVATLCWAGNPAAGKLALRGFDSVALAQVRAIAAAGILSALVIVRCKLSTQPAGRLRRLHLRQWLMLAVVGLSGITLNQLLFVAGLARTSALHSGLIGALGPVIVLAMAVARHDEPLTGWKLGGMMTALVGVVMVVSHTADPVAGGSWLGDLMVLASTVAFSAYTVLQKGISGWEDDLTLNAVVFAFGAVLMLPFGVRSALAVNWTAIPSEAWMGLLYMILCGSVLAYIIYAFALRHLLATRVAAFSYLQPVLTSLIAVWLVHERVTATEVIGGILILGGMYFTGERGAGYEENREVSSLDAASR